MRRMATFQSSINLYLNFRVAPRVCSLSFQDRLVVNNYARFFFIKDTRFREKRNRLLLNNYVVIDTFAADL